MVGVLPGDLVELPLQHFQKNGVKRAVAEVRWEGHLSHREDLVKLVSTVRGKIIRKEERMEVGSMDSFSTAFSSAPTAITIAEERQAKLMERRKLNNARVIERDVNSLLKNFEQATD